MILRALFASSIALLSIGSIGCGGGPPATVDGTIGGDKFLAVDAVSSTFLNGKDTSAVIFVSTEATSCDLLGKNQIHKSSQFLLITLANVNFTGMNLFAPTGPNTFPIHDPSNPVIDTSTVSTVSYVKSDAMCQTPTGADDAVTGTVTLTSAVDEAYAGSGDVTLKSGAHVTFTFDSTTCPALATELTATTMATCL